MDQLSPQNWEDMMISSQKKDKENRFFNLEWTANKLKDQLDKNKELNESYQANLKQYRSSSENKYEEQSDQDTDQEQQDPNIQYYNKIVEKYTKQQQRRRPCCEQLRSLDMPRVPKKMLEYSKEEVWARLLEDRRQTFEQRELDKRKQQDEIAEQCCTFKPQISEKAQLLQKEEPVDERLYQESVEQRKRKDNMIREHLQTEQYTFKPSISTYKQVLKGDNLLTKPLYERIDEVLKKKQEELTRKQQEAFQQGDHTFQPKISQKSVQIADQKMNHKSVIDRLMDDAVQKIQKKFNVDQDKKQEECTFNPQINPTMDEARQINQVFNVQYLFADFMREKKEKLMQQFYDDYTFKPTINKQSAMIIESNEDRLNEDPNQKYERLGQKDYEKNKMLKEQIQEAYYNQYTYKPQINQISSIIARKRSLDNLAYNPDRKEKLRILKEEQEQKQSHSFYPQTSKTSQYQHIKSKYQKDNLKQNLQLEQELKERKVVDLKKQLQYEELKDCTFKPMVKEYQKDDEPTEKLVKGLDKFLQNKENIKKKQEAQQQREKEVFNYELKYDFKNHLHETKPIPFQIKQKNSQLQKYLQEEAIHREKEQCTFTPQINQRKY
ncbi:hypothetical protein pb186bvf_001672 [Paramecium bursaria]